MQQSHTVELQTASCHTGQHRITEHNQ